MVQRAIQRLLSSIRHRRALGEFRREFARKFPGTRITPQGIFDLSLVAVQPFSYGDLNVMAFKNPEAFLSIGRFVSIGPGVTFILEGNHPIDHISTYPMAIEADSWAIDPDTEGHVAGTKGPILVRDDVWIGTNTIILSGLTIGQGAVVAAGSVVTRDVEPYGIVGGNPARLIRYRFSPAIVDTLVRRADYAKLDINRLREYRALLAMPLTEESIERVLQAFES
jgi:virginiamycin A acetyltransferase